MTKSSLKPLPLFDLLQDKRPSALPVAKPFTNFKKKFGKGSFSNFSILT